MSVDKKTAQHICNVIRRQVQTAFPDLYIHFSIHKENDRKETLMRETSVLEEHPAGRYLNEYSEYHDVEATDKILSKNKSRFACIAYKNTPGFLGFFKNDAYFALCFVNHERFTTEDNLRNHAFTIAWHAITLYKDFVNRKKTIHKHASMPLFIDDHNVLIPNLDNENLALRNLAGDIFSTCVQIQHCRKNPLQSINMQRITDTLSAQKGFKAEIFPFPSCSDSLEKMLKSKAARIKKNKKPILTAVKMTENIIKTYDYSVIEQWKSFSLPAQKMAWAGHDPKTILGAAIFTSENTYTQSTADIVSEKMNIKPNTITAFQDENPFAKTEKNENNHISQCKRLIKTGISGVKTQQDFRFLLDIAWKQTGLLLENKIMGWCAPALTRASEIIKHCNDTSLMQNIIIQAEEVFLAEIENIKWDTLSHFSNIIFEKRRDGLVLNYHDLMEISAQNDEFATIHQTLTFLKKYNEEDVPDELPEVHLEKQEVDIFKFVKPEKPD